MEAVRNGCAELSGDGAEHLRRVLRAERGQRFELSDNGHVYLAEIDDFGKGKVRFRVIEEIAAAPPTVGLVLLASLVKFDRFEWMIEKATELSVETIIPVMAGRSDKGLDAAAHKRVDRWRKIAIESSQQSRRTRLPEISDVVSFAKALTAAGGCRFFLEEESGADPILSAIPDRRAAADRVALLVGPEGGWTDEERGEASKAGWRAVSLGPQILRAETAAVAALAVISAAWSARGGER